MREDELRHDERGCYERRDRAEAADEQSSCAGSGGRYALFLRWTVRHR